MELSMIDSRNLNPRYIHAIDHWTGDNYNSFTVAYIREHNHVWFAWAKLSEGDVYNKSIGRQVSYNRLATQLPRLMVIADYNNTVNYHIESMSGYMQFNHVAVNSALKKVLSDQMIAQMDFYDLKHAFISEMIFDLISYKIK
jgi:hypothetical protein